MARTMEWSRELCIRALDTFVQVHGRVPKITEWHAEYGLPSESTFRKHVHMHYTDYYRMQYGNARHITQRLLRNREECIQKLDDFIRENDRRPIRTEYWDNPKLPTVSEFANIVGVKPDEYINKNYDLPQNPLTWDSGRCEWAARRFVNRTGKPPQAADFVTDRSLALPPVFVNYMGCSYSEYMRTEYPELERPTEPLGYFWTKEWCELALDRYMSIKHRAPSGFECSSIKWSAPHRSDYRSHGQDGDGNWPGAFPRSKECTL